MMTVPDLAALREKAEKATTGPWEHVSGRDFVGEPFNEVVMEREGKTIRRAAWFGDFDDEAGYVAAVSPDVLLAILSLIDGLRAENERLRDASAGWQEALIALGACSSPTSQTERERYEKADVVRRYLLGIRRALAGPPAANEEATDA